LIARAEGTLAQRLVRSSTAAIDGNRHNSCLVFAVCVSGIMLLPPTASTACAGLLVYWPDLSVTLVLQIVA
jgi:hypothetical protein